jgi:hypothetical protein
MTIDNHHQGRDIERPIKVQSETCSQLVHAIGAAAFAFVACETLPELSESPLVVVQTAPLAGSLTYSWSLVLPGDLHVWFEDVDK